jgi:dihydroorotase-like cyclic amidohydrolase
MNRKSLIIYFVAYPSGRTAWEGFETATKAAAAGGVTTLVGEFYTGAGSDMRYAIELFTANDYG